MLVGEEGGEGGHSRPRGMGQRTRDLDSRSASGTVCHTQSARRPRNTSWQAEHRTCRSGQCLA